MITKHKLLETLELIHAHNKRGFYWASHDLGPVVLITWDRNRESLVLTYDREKLTEEKVLEHVLSKPIKEFL